MAVNPHPLFAVVVAAGEGLRLGAGERKAAVRLGGVPLAVRSARALEDAPGWIGGALVVHPHDRQRAEEVWRTALADPSRWRVVQGGGDRGCSTERGLREAPADAEMLLVHDAARPLLHREDLVRVVEVATERGAAILASRVTGTVKRVGPLSIETIDRSDLWSAETPQVFTAGSWRSALALVPRHPNEWILGDSDLHDLRSFTDEAGLLEAAGIEVAVVESGHPNPKITTAADLAMAEALIASRE